MYHSTCKYLLSETRSLGLKPHFAETPNQIVRINGTTWQNSGKYGILLFCLKFSFFLSPLSTSPSSLLASSHSFLLLLLLLLMMLLCLFVMDFFVLLCFVVLFLCVLCSSMKIYTSASKVKIYFIESIGTAHSVYPWSSNRQSLSLSQTMLLSVCSFVSKYSPHRLHVARQLARAHSRYC